MIAQIDIQEELRRSIANLMKDKDLSQAAIADIAETDAGQLSKIMKGRANFTLAHVENLARYFGLRTIDIFTYPQRYVAPEGPAGHEPAEVLLQMRLTKEKKDQVLKLVFGDNNIEILNW